VNTDEPEQVLYEAQARVLKIQTKLHRWASDDPHRRFDDLFNLVVDPAFLWWPGTGYEATRVPAQREWTAIRPCPSRSGTASRSFSTGSG